MAASTLFFCLCLGAVLLVATAAPTSLHFATERMASPEAEPSSEPTEDEGENGQFLWDGFSARTLGKEFYINCGGDGVAEFQPDYFHWLVGETSSFQKPQIAIAGAELGSEKVYKSHRYGLFHTKFGYNLPIKSPGIYMCTLLFAETFSLYAQTGARVFDVAVYGDGEKRVETNIDVFARAGAANTVHKVVLKDIAAHDMIHLRLTPVVGDAFISGIHCAHSGEVASK